MKESIVTGVDFIFAKKPSNQNIPLKSSNKKEKIVPSKTANHNIKRDEIFKKNEDTI